MTKPGKAGKASSSASLEQPGELAVAIKRSREKAGLSLRELARRLGVSASFVSQLEHGKAKPSVETLFAIANETGLSVDEFLTTNNSNGASKRPRRGIQINNIDNLSASAAIELDHGVRWHRLATADPAVEFLYTEYPPGADSAPPGHLQTHAGHDHGVILEGTLTLTLGRRRYELRAGDTVSFPGSTGHRLSNDTDTTARAIWLVDQADESVK